MGRADVTDRGDVTPAMQDQHVRKALSARQLPRALQPTQGVRISQERPRLVEHEIAESVLQGDDLLRGGDGAQRGNGKRVRRPLRRKIEDHELTGEDHRLVVAVEQSGEVAVDESVQRQRHAPFRGRGRRRQMNVQ